MEVAKNNERQYNLDLLKALAIVCMVVCRVIITFGQYRPDYYSCNLLDKIAGVDDNHRRVDDKMTCWPGG